MGVDRLPYGPAIPTLRVTSIPGSLEFYRGLLGFSLKWAWSEAGGFDDRGPLARDAPDLVCVEGGQAVLFLARNSGSSQSWIFFELPQVEDIDELAESVSGVGIIEQAPADMPWGSRELVLLYPDGHRLRFSCPLDRKRERFGGTGS